MIRKLVIVLATVAASALAVVACGAGSDEKPSGLAFAPAPQSDCWATRARAAVDSRATIVSAGVERQYLLHVPRSSPPSYDGIAPAPPPLLLAFHGGGSNAQFTADMTALTKAADAYGMVVAFPEATATTQVWNVYGSADPSADLAFSVDLIAHLKESLCIDAGRVYATGFSVGAGMALKLACEHPRLIASVAAVAAPFVSCPAGAPLIAFHGDEDPIAPYKGRAGEGSLPPVERAVQQTANAMDCDGAQVSRIAPDIELSTHNCLNGKAEVLLYTVLGGGHTWPGAAIELPVEVVGATTHAIGATDLMLAFFAAHRRP